MKPSLIACLGFLALGSVVLAAARPDAQDAKSPEEVSLIRLIANPHEYDGHLVMVIGYVCTEFEGTAIYVHEADRKFMISRNGLWLDAPDEPKDLKSFMSLDHKYALIIGVFHADKHGHMGAFSGSIDDLSRFAFWSDLEGWKPSSTVEKLK